MIDVLKVLGSSILHVSSRHQDQLRNPIPIQQVTSHSQGCGPGSLFIAISGGSVDGHQYIESAVKAGAILVVGEKPLAREMDVPYLQVKDSRAALALLAAEFYQHPSKGMLVVGITGTSGKTTTSYLIESILQSAGYQVGVIGTINFRFGREIFPSTHTTPGPVELQGILAKMKETGCNAVVMEVSSHALKQKRAHCIAFDRMIFTNLSPEHLDFHPDMEDYFQAKVLLFTELAQFAMRSGKKPKAVVNREDAYGRRLLQLLESFRESSQGSVEVYAYPKEEDVEVRVDGISGRLEGVQVQSGLTGYFNVSNLAAAVALAKTLGMDDGKITEGVGKLKGVPGRLENVPNSLGIHVWVDYAHKPDALEKVLHSLTRIQGRFRLITVLGCGGDRDRTKRPVMGKIAAQASSHVFVTSDNPRTENPRQIIDEILSGIPSQSSNVTVVVDRREAIFQAIQYASEGDLVLIAGKGHEDYQILGTKKVHFDDREVAQEAFLFRNSGNA